MELRLRRPTWLLVIALFGFIVPNGMFVYWLVTDFHGLAPIFRDRLALSFILDALLALIMLSLYFARNPAGRYGWQWFLALSLAGGLGFGIPFYWWLNGRDAPDPSASSDPGKGAEHGQRTTRRASQPGP